MIGRALILGIALSVPLVVSAQITKIPYQKNLKPFRVVIDPGHGGSDRGAIYDNGTLLVSEKDVTLLLAKQVAAQLRAKGFKVVLTRTSDQEVPLGERTALANRLRADVFISLHMNATSTPMVTDAQGVETYILNNTTDATSKRLAHLENTVLGNRNSATDSPEQMDVALILRDLRLDANLSESKRLACQVQNHLAPSKHKNRGVRQALFHVLLGAEMPSILVEAGFLNNTSDRALVLSPQGRTSVGRSIAHAVERFRREKNTALASVALSKCKVR